MYSEIIYNYEEIKRKLELAGHKCIINKKIGFSWCENSSHCLKMNGEEQYNFKLKYICDYLINKKHHKCIKFIENKTKIIWCNSDKCILNQTCVKNNNDKDKYNDCDILIERILNNDKNISLQDIINYSHIETPWCHQTIEFDAVKVALFKNKIKNTLFDHGHICFKDYNNKCDCTNCGNISYSWCRNLEKCMMKTKLEESMQEINMNNINENLEKIENENKI
jgi:hypothetical protein